MSVLGPWTGFNPESWGRWRPTRFSRDWVKKLKKNASWRVQFRTQWRGATLVTISMKAKITITPKKAVLDPQGKAVLNALEHLGYDGVSDVRVGKYLELDVASDSPEFRQTLDEACHRFLSNQSAIHNLLH